MAWTTSKGFNFRATSGYVTDATNETYVIGESYPTTRSIAGESVTFGWESQAIDPSRDRRNTAPWSPELSGLAIIRPSDTSDSVFRVDLPSTGLYLINTGSADPDNNLPTIFELRDGTTSFQSTSVTLINTGSVADATGFVHSSVASWRSNPNMVNHIFNTTILRLVLKIPSGSLSNIIDHITIIPINSVGTLGQFDPCMRIQGWF